MKKLFVASILVLISNLLIAQAKLHVFNEKKLSVSWEVIENNYQNKDQTLSAFTLSNNGGKALPEYGWNLYFNFVRTIQPKTVTGGVKIEHVNGDLYRLNVNTQITKGAPLRVEFVSGDWVVNFTDAPGGLYIVWDDKPAKGIPLSNYTIKPSTQRKQYMRNASDKVEVSAPELTYEKNKSIQDIPLNKLPKVLPTPVKYTETTGEFTLNKDVDIVANPEFKAESDYFISELKTLIEQGNDKSPGGKVNLTKKAELPEEAYELQIKQGEINIAASSGAGIFYGMQSIKLLLPTELNAVPQKEIKLPAVEIEDAPRFATRALMLDVARNFQSKQEVLKLLDLMALYKLNIFHFHLNDDEGWRLEIPALPELTAVGSKRGHTVDHNDHLQPSLGSGPGVENPHASGFYSKADFLEILRYATARHIQVVTEIETPGHARAAVKAMDARYLRLLKEGKREDAERYLLHHLNDKSVFSSVQMWNDNVMDVAMPSTYRFLETVINELELMYKEANAPLKTIHVGGDEVPAGVWEKSPACMILMRSNPSIKTTNDLWYYYFGKVNQILKAKGLYLSGWEEIGMRKVAADGAIKSIPNPDFANQNFQMEVWNNVLGWGQDDLAYQLANAGYKVVLSGVSNSYFDMAYEKSFEEPGYYWGSYIDIDKPYEFIPLNYTKNIKEDKMGNQLSRSSLSTKTKLTDIGKANIVGLQAALWGETIKGADRMEYMLLPKLLSFAERAWAKEPDWAIEPDSAKSEEAYQQAWNEFVNVLGKRELPRLSYYKGGFSYRIPPAGAKIEGGKVFANAQFPGFVIRYTVDGTEPTTESPIYKGPLITKDIVKLRVFNTKGRPGRTVEVGGAPGIKVTKDRF